MRCFTECYEERPTYNLQNNTYRECIDSSGDGYGEEMDRTGSGCNVPNVPARVVGLPKNYHRTKKGLADYKARLMEATERYDALKALETMAERSDALQNKMLDITIEGALKCSGMMGTVCCRLIWRYLDSFSS